jgi:hypothetical protein
MPEVPTAAGILSARQEARRRASVGVAMVGEAVGVVTAGEAVGMATIGEVVGAGITVGAGVGASASDGRTVAATGHRAGRSAQILGCTILMGTPTPIITATTGPTIRRRTVQIRRITTTRQETI